MFKYFFTEINYSIVKGKEREKHFILSIRTISQPSFTFWAGIFLSMKFFSKPILLFKKKEKMDFGGEVKYRI
jgi:hypothetical protein